MLEKQQTIIKTVKLRLLPSQTEANTLWRHASASRVVWNKGINYLQKRRACGMKHVGFMTKEEGLAKFFVQLKNEEEYSWIKELSSTSIRYSLKRLDIAYKAAFQRLKNGEGAGFPKFHKWAADGSFTVPDKDRFSVGKRGLCLEKIGWVRMRPRDNQAIGIPKQVIIKRENGKWFAFIQCETTISTPIHEGEKVGIDMGIAKTFTLDNGTSYQKPQAKKLEARRRRYQRIMARRREAVLRKVAGWDGKSKTRKTAEQMLGKIHKAKMETEKDYRLPRYSKRYEIAKTRCAKTTRKLTNIRHNFCHQISSEITRDYGFISIENSQIKNMTKSAKGTAAVEGKNVAQKRGLNKSILEQGWGITANMLEYKAQWRGGAVEKVNPQNTSRACFECGHVAKENRKTQKEFLCVKCGHSDNADVNAARNILAKGDKATVSGDGDISRSMKLKTPTSQGCALRDSADKQSVNLNEIKTPLRSG